MGARQVGVRFLRDCLRLEERPGFAGAFRTSGGMGGPLEAPISNVGPPFGGSGTPNAVLKIPPSAGRREPSRRVAYISVAGALHARNGDGTP